jgi:4a-hydroxytetrahydrobiopterin dehydratase
MNTLRQQKCEVCQIGAPLATPREIDEYLQQAPDWTVTEVDGVKRLRRTFGFKDFNTALAFTNKIGELADQEDHHPEIVTEWGKVTVSWWSHKIKGLHKNDFIMAAKTDALI